jgi:hypothetical protein
MKLFKEKYLREEEIKKSALRIVDETNLMNAVIQFIEDSGNYKKRSLYKISDYDLKVKLREMRNKMIQLQANMIFADIILGSNDSLYKKYQELSEKVSTEIVKQQQLKMKSAINKEIKVDKKEVN